jgi:hypothetical protein
MCEIEHPRDHGDRLVTARGTLAEDYVCSPIQTAAGHTAYL